MLTFRLILFNFYLFYKRQQVGEVTGSSAESYHFLWNNTHGITEIHDPISGQHFNFNDNFNDKCAIFHLNKEPKLHHHELLHMVHNRVHETVKHKLHSQN